MPSLQGAQHANAQPVRARGRDSLWAFSGKVALQWLLLSGGDCLRGPPAHCPLRLALPPSSARWLRGSAGPRTLRRGAGARKATASAASSCGLWGASAGGSQRSWHMGGVGLLSRDLAWGGQPRSTTKSRLR
jgi:hypothetical protein